MSGDHTITTYHKTLSFDYPSHTASILHAQGVMLQRIQFRNRLVPMLVIIDGHLEQKSVGVVQHT